MIEKILGFTITQKQDGKYYANKRIKGKLHWVYIGNDLAQAENKVIGYLGKHKLGVESKNDYISQNVELENRISRLEKIVREQQETIVRLERMLANKIQKGTKFNGKNQVSFVDTGKRKGKALLDVIDEVEKNLAYDNFLNAVEEAKKTFSSES